MSSIGQQHPELSTVLLNFPLIMSSIGQQHPEGKNWVFIFFVSVVTELQALPLWHSNASSMRVGILSVLFTHEFQVPRTASGMWRHVANVCQVSE